MFESPGCFTFVHEFFRKSMIVVRVANLPPLGISSSVPPSSPFLWYNHLGGFEGIAQKHWKICTYSMIDFAMQSFALSYVLIRQADNQILSVKIKRNHLIERRVQLVTLRDSLTKAISEGCWKINQIVKSEKCLESTKVITYSKDIYIDGVYYSIALLETPRIQYLIARKRLLNLKWFETGFRKLTSQKLWSFSLAEKKAYNLYAADNQREKYDILNPEEYSKLLNFKFITGHNNQYQRAGTIFSEIYKNCLTALKI